MKKLLLFAAVLLSACARDITVYKNLDVVEPVSTPAKKTTPEDIDMLW